MVKLGRRQDARRLQKAKQLDCQAIQCFMERTHRLARTRLSPAHDIAATVCIGCCPSPVWSMVSALG